MDQKTFVEMSNALHRSLKRFPNCRIANCDCNSEEGEWKKNCHCMCHFSNMDEKYGKDKWTLKQFSEEAERGMKLV